MSKGQRSLWQIPGRIMMAPLCCFAAIVLECFEVYEEVMERRAKRAREESNEGGE